MNRDGLLNSKLNLILITIVVLISFGLTNNIAYAQVLQFDHDSYFYDHKSRLIATGIDTLDNSLSVQVFRQDGTTCPDPFSFTLDRTTGTTFVSPYIAFVSIAEPCTSTTFSIAEPSDDSSVTITASITTPVSLSASANLNRADIASGWTPAAMIPEPMWTKRISNCGSPASTLGGDQDGDGICDKWEDQNGFVGLKINYLLPTTSTTAFYTYTACGAGLPDSECPSKIMKDVYVEVDWMQGHSLDPVAKTNLISAFRSLKTGIPSGCTGGCLEGIRLHIIEDEELSYHRHAITAAIEGNAFNTEFDTIRKAQFGNEAERNIADSHQYNPPTGPTYDQALTSKKQAFHYALIMHQQSNDLGASGRGETPGDDFIISLGAWTGGYGSTDQQEGTFMHELGHNLGLEHGGPIKDNGVNVPAAQYSINCKPNYMSVMNYAMQFRETYPINRPLNYSNLKQGTLVETELPESSGGGLSDAVAPWDMTVYGVPTDMVPDGFMIAVVDGSSSINWDGNDSGPDPTSGNINKLASAFCDGSGETTMNGFNDTKNLILNSKGWNSWSGGMGSTENPGGVGSDGKPVWQEVISTDGQKKFYYDSEMHKSTKWNNILKKLLDMGRIKVKYAHFAKELNYAQMIDARISRIHVLDNLIQTTSDTSFRLSADDKPFFNSELKIVADYIKADNLYEARKKLLELVGEVTKRVTEPADEKNIIREMVDGNIKLIDVALITHSETIPDAHLVMRPDYSKFGGAKIAPYP